MKSKPFVSLLAEAIPSQFWASHAGDDAFIDIDKHDAHELAAAIIEGLKVSYVNTYQGTDIDYCDEVYATQELAEASEKRLPDAGICVVIPLPNVEENK